MKDSIMKHKRVLGVAGEMDSLSILEEEILGACPECRFDKATTFEMGVQYLASYTYDLVVLDIVAVRGSDLLDQVLVRNFPAVVLMDNAAPPEVLERFMASGARALLTKEKLKEIVPTIEQVIRIECMPKWKRALRKLRGDFQPWFCPNGYGY